MNLIFWQVGEIYFWAHCLWWVYSLKHFFRINFHIFCWSIFLLYNTIKIVAQNFTHCVLFSNSFLLEFFLYLFLDLLLFLTLLIDFFHFKSRFVNFYDTNQPKKLYNSNGPDGRSGSFWLCSDFTESVAVGWAWRVNDISEHWDIKKERNGTDTIEPEEKAKEIIFKYKTTENDFDGKDDNQNDIENIEIDIVRFLCSYDSDIVADEWVNCEKSDNDLQRNTASR